MLAQDKRPAFWVLLGDMRTNKPLVTPSRVLNIPWLRAEEAGKTSESKTIRIQFQAPPKPGEYPFTLWVKSDSYVGTDARGEVKAR